MSKTSDSNTTIYEKKTTTRLSHHYYRNQHHHRNYHHHHHHHRRRRRAATSTLMLNIFSISLFWNHTIMLMSTHTTKMVIASSFEKGVNRYGRMTIPSSAFLTNHNRKSRTSNRFITSTLNCNLMSRNDLQADYLRSSTTRSLLQMSSTTTKTTTTTTIASSISTPCSYPSSSSSSSTSGKTPKIVIISESKWRSDAYIHSNHIRQLLQPGLTSIHDPINSGLQKRKLKRLGNHHKKTTTRHMNSHKEDDEKSDYDELMNIWTALDGKNPIYNFLIEYYGLKGAKGPRRLSRWSPDPKLLLLQDVDTTSLQYNHNNDNGDDNNEVMVQYITNDKNTDEGSTLGIDKDMIIHNDKIITAIMECTKGKGGIFLENANENDLNGTLNLRGAIPITTTIECSSSSSSSSLTTDDKEDRMNNVELHGMLYNPYLFYNNNNNNNKPPPPTTTTQKLQIQKTIAPFQWYKSILQTTLQSEPIFHCHGLHEWAMLYHPPNAPPPPSAKYQKDLPIRVSRQTINDTVERRGISCTHVDALRFFAPAAGPLNHHGSSLERMDQLTLEQKGCVHAHMDLLKIALKLQPFLGGELLCEVLEVSIAARRLDVEASPYDVSGYGGGVVAVETEDGRREYRRRQRELMEMAEPVRVRLLDAYDVFLGLAFDEEALLTNSTGGNDHGNDKGVGDDEAKGCEGGGVTSDKNDIEISDYAAPERFAKAEPGGLPWRKSLIS